MKVKITQGRKIRRETLYSGEMLRDFNEFMSERILLNHQKAYHPDNVRRICDLRKIRGKYANNDGRITGGFWIPCNVEPELYLLLQERVKKLTGDYMPMDEMIHMLLSWFCWAYSEDQPKAPPFKKVLPGAHRRKISMFKAKMGKYFKNTLYTCKDIV